MPNRRRRRRTRRSNPATPLPPFLRRRSTRWLAAAIVTLAVGLSLSVIAGTCDDTGDGAPAGPTPTLAVELPGIEPDPALLERAAVVRVIDGDTIDVEIVGGGEERVRYFGIDTPERGDDCYGEASGRNEALIGESVLLLPDARDRDPNGRLLRYVFTSDGDSIDALLIAEGLARAWTRDGQYRDDLIALEDAARAAGVGCLWE